MKRFCFLLIPLLIIGCKNEEKGQEEKYQIQQSTTPKASGSLKESMDRGKIIYNNYCASCHLTNGKGITNAFPPLANSDWLRNKPEESIRAVKHGINGRIEVNGETYEGLMPDLGLNDQQVADVMNYINNSWGNNYGDEVTVEEVEAVKK